MDEAFPNKKVDKVESTLDSVQGFTEPTPLTELIPGIDLTKLSSQERLDAVYAEAKFNRADEFGTERTGDSSSIGAPWGDTPYINWFMDTYPEAFALLRERFKGKVIVDIGMGSFAHGYKFANLFGAKAYIGVDLFFGRRAGEFIAKRTELDAASGNLASSDVPPEAHEYVGMPRAYEIAAKLGIRKSEAEQIRPDRNNTPWNVVQDDALAFLEALPADSVSLFAGGFENSVIPEGHRRKIYKEIRRVLGKQDAFLCANSEDVTDNTHVLKLKIVKFFNGRKHQSGAIYEKG